MKIFQLAHLNEVIASCYHVQNRAPLAQDFRIMFAARLDPQTPEGQRLRQEQVAYLMRAATRLPIRPEQVALDSHGGCTVQIPAHVSRTDIAQGMRTHLPWLSPDVLQPPRLTSDQWAATPLTTPEGWNPLDLRAISKNLRRPITTAQLLDDLGRGTFEAFGHYMQDRSIGQMARSDTQAGSVVMHYADGRPSKTLRLDALDIRADKPVKHFLRDLSDMPFDRHAANALDKDPARPASARPSTVWVTNEQWAEASLATPEGWPALNPRGIANQLPVSSEALLRMQGAPMAQAAGRFLKARGIEQISRSPDLAGHVVLQFAQGPSRSVQLDQLDAAPEAEGAAALRHYLRDLGRTPDARHAQRQSLHYTAVAPGLPQTARTAVTRVLRR